MHANRIAAGLIVVGLLIACGSSDDSSGDVLGAPDGGVADGGKSSSSSGGASSSGSSSSSGDGGPADDSGTSSGDGGRSAIGDTTNQTCGDNACATATNICCVDPRGAAGTKCVAKTDGCGNKSAALGCSGQANCATGTVCCLNGSGDTSTSACKAKCDQNEAQLCDPKATTTGCAAGKACSSKNISDWNLPKTFATCGGVEAP